MAASLCGKEAGGITMAKMRTLHGRQATSISEIRAGRDEQGQVSATCAFVPLSFELGHAFQFDWSEEGLVIGGIDRQTQAPMIFTC
jgi:hypothetical protein